jgi:hypothetical protein
MDHVVWIVCCVASVSWSVSQRFVFPICVKCLVCLELAGKGVKIKIAGAVGGKG